MRALTSGQALVAKNVLLDGRLALFHEREKWLAVADLHFGYELSQRAAGNLYPLWGMDASDARLIALLQDYEPERLIILGDLVHDRAASDEAQALLKRARKLCEVIVIAGNHDRQLGKKFEFVDSWQTRRFYFHHGHCAVEPSARIQIVGHHHPAGTISDGAGLHLKLPAFVKQQKCWIMPAFSPWASGTPWISNDESKIWLCSPHRVLLLEENRSTA
jgi:DNA ligase-associated metallophosphoesterase